MIKALQTQTEYNTVKYNPYIVESVCMSMGLTEESTETK